MEQYETFYQKHKTQIFNYLMRMTGEYYLASDILQESFTRCLEHYGKRPPSLALLFTIARNALFDSFRLQRRNRPLADEPSTGTVNQEQQLLIRDEYRRVLKAMQELSEDEREILALAITDGLSYLEIAAIVGISIGNVKVKVHRSRLKLRESLSKGDENE